MTVLDKNHQIPGNEREVFQTVVRQLALLGTPGVNYDELHEAAHLIDDVGLDSLKFVELTVSLESAFGIAEFPMQDWVDEQLANNRPLTVGALVAVCSSLLV